MPRVVKRSVFPISTMKKLASEIINSELYARKAALKAEIITDYNSNEGKAVLSEIEAVGFESRKMKPLKALSARLKKFKDLLTGEVTEQILTKVCKELHFDYQEKYGSVDLQSAANDLLSVVLGRQNANTKEIAELSEKKSTFLELNKRYLSERKPVLQKWREDYRHLVIEGRKFVGSDSELVALKELLKSQKSDEKRETRVKIEDLESRLHKEAVRRLIDTQQISTTLGVDPLVAQRLSFIFGKRQEIDELSSREIRIAKLGEVLSLLAEKLTHAMISNIRSGLATQDPLDMKITLNELRGGDKTNNPAIVLAFCSQTKSSIDNGTTFVVSDYARQHFTSSVKNIITSVTKRVLWDKAAKEALCAIVHDVVSVLTVMFKGSITGKAKTISAFGVKQVVHNYLVSHQVDPALFDDDLDRIF